MPQLAPLVLISASNRIQFSKCADVVYDTVGLPVVCRHQPNFSVEPNVANVRFINGGVRPLFLSFTNLPWLVGMVPDPESIPGSSLSVRRECALDETAVYCGTPTRTFGPRGDLASPIHLLRRWEETGKTLDETHTGRTCTETPHGQEAERRIRGWLSHTCFVL